jgi:hypothetical protein
MALFFLLGASAGLASCARRTAPAMAFAPLRYDYLPPIRLNVASIDIDQRFVPAPGGPLALDPVQPADALRQMAQDRLQAMGSAGRAVFAINDASIVQFGDSLSGLMAVQLDVYTSDATRAAFAEARVARRSALAGQDLRSALYELTKQMMDAMNVEFEFQVRRALRDWLITSPAGVPAPVEEQPLPPPPS